MDELPDLHLDNKEEELVRKGPWWLVVDRRVEDVEDLDAGTTSNLVNKEEFAWPLFAFTWRDFLPGQLAELFVAVTRRPLPSLLEVVDGEFLRVGRTSVTKSG